MSFDEADREPQEDGAAAERSAWRRDAGAQDINARLGQRIREHREALGMSLNAAQRLTGIPAATLSRIENNRMAPTMPLVLKLLYGLRMSWADLTANLPLQIQGSQISVAASGEGERIEVNGNVYTIPHTDSRLRRHIQPVIFDIGSRTVEEAGGLRGHEGTELCYVLSGSLLLHFVDRPPVELGVGGSTLFNAEIPHAYVAKSRGRARVLLANIVDPLMHNPDALAPLISSLRKNTAGDEGR